VSLDALLPVAQDAAALPGASAGGRARQALRPCGAAGERSANLERSNP
jgi:hypothetical protein